MIFNGVWRHLGVCGILLRVSQCPVAVQGGTCSLAPLCRAHPPLPQAALSPQLLLWDLWLLPLAAPALNSLLCHEQVGGCGVPVFSPAHSPLPSMLLELVGCAAGAGGTSLWCASPQRSSTGGKWQKEEGMARSCPCCPHLVPACLPLVATVTLFQLLQGQLPPSGIQWPTPELPDLPHWAGPANAKHYPMPCPQGCLAHCYPPCHPNALLAGSYQPAYNPNIPLPCSPTILTAASCLFPLHPHNLGTIALWAPQWLPSTYLPLVTCSLPFSP